MPIPNMQYPSSRLNYLLSLWDCFNHVHHENTQLFAASSILPGVLDTNEAVTEFPAAGGCVSVTASSGFSGVVL